MLKKANPKIIAQRLLIAVICIGFGILLGAQVRSLPARVTNPIAPYISLKDTRDDLYSEQDDLKKEIKSLQTEIQGIQTQNENSILTQAEINSLNLKKAQAGLTKLNGPGLIIRLDDSKSVSASGDSIVHAADLRDITNLLWSSGAEAISINDQRVVGNTAIDCIVNTILVNNVRLSTPFQIEAIGNQAVMYDRLATQNNLADLYRRKTDNGITFDLSRNNDITVPIFDGSFETNITVGN